MSNSNSELQQNQMEEGINITPSTNSILPLKRSLSNSLDDLNNTFNTPSEKTDSNSNIDENLTNTNLPPTKKLSLCSSSTYSEINSFTSDDLIKIKNQDNTTQNSIEDSFKILDTSEQNNDNKIDSQSFTKEHAIKENKSSDILNSENTISISNNDQERNNILSKQMEYYFCDDNMKYDIFFRKTMDENDEPYKDFLNIATILNCPRIKKLQASQEEILDSIKESSNIIIKRDDKNNIWLGRSKPLPPFEKKKPKHFHSKKKPISDYHLAGCLVKISEIPSEITSWSEVKTSLQKLLPDGITIKFASQLGTQGICNMWVKPFSGDKEVLPSLKPELNDSFLQIKLMDDETEIKNFLNVEMPKRLRMQREKLIARTRSKMVQQPLSLANQTFNNIDHLKKCISELLEKTEENNFLKSNSIAEKVIIELLNYHPNILLKSSVSGINYVGIKVLLSTKEKEKSETKCFAITIKEDDDKLKDILFRFDKCIKEISRNPPLIENTTSSNDVEN